MKTTMEATELCAFMRETNSANYVVSLSLPSGVAVYTSNEALVELVKNHLVVLLEEEQRDALGEVEVMDLGF